MEPETLLRIQPSYKVTVMPSTLQMVLIHYLYTYGTLKKNKNKKLHQLLLQYKPPKIWGLKMVSLPYCLHVYTMAGSSVLTYFGFLMHL